MSEDCANIKIRIALPSDPDAAPVAAHSSGVVYSKEYLSELKANTQSVPSPTRLPNGASTSAMILDASEMDGAIIVNEEVTEGKVAFTSWISVIRLSFIQKLLLKFLLSHRFK